MELATIHPDGIRGAQVDCLAMHLNTEVVD
jgi:hypothetical protein